MSRIGDGLDITQTVMQGMEDLLPDFSEAATVLESKAGKFMEKLGLHHDDVDSTNPSSSIESTPAVADPVKKGYIRYANTKELVRAFERTQDPQARKNLTKIMLAVINEFASQPVKSLDNIKEIIPLAACDDKEVQDNLLEMVINPIATSQLVHEDMVQGLAQIVELMFQKEHGKESTVSKDALVKVLTVIATQMQALHTQDGDEHTSKQLEIFLIAARNLLDVMVDQDVKGLSKDSLRDPLYQFLNDNQQAANLKLRYLANYAQQATVRVPDDESNQTALLKRGVLVCQGLIAVSKVVASQGADIGSIFDAVTNLTAAFTFKKGKANWYTVVRRISDITQALAAIENPQKNRYTRISILKETDAAPTECGIVLMSDVPKESMVPAAFLGVAGRQVLKILDVVLVERRRQIGIKEQLDSMRATANAVYVRVADQLYYAGNYACNDTSGCLRIDITADKLAAFDREMKPDLEFRCLNTDELTRIRSLTDHTSSLVDRNTIVLQKKRDTKSKEDNLIGYWLGDNGKLAEKTLKMTEFEGIALPESGGCSKDPTVINQIISKYGCTQQKDIDFIVQVIREQGSHLKKSDQWKFVYGVTTALKDLLEKTKPNDAIRPPVFKLMEEMYLNTKTWGRSKKTYQSLLITLIELIEKAEDPSLSQAARTVLTRIELDLLKKEKNKKTEAYKRYHAAMRNAGVKEARDIKYVGKEPTFTSRALSLLDTARRNTFPLEYRADKIYENFQSLRAPGGALAQDLEMYVPVQGKPSEQSEQRFDVKTQALQFTHALEDNKKVLLIQGGAGAGKTLFLRYLEASLWENYSVDDPIPLFMSLPALANPTHQAVEQVLKGYGCSNDEIARFKKEKRFIFLLDGFDEIKTERNIYETNQFKDWTCQVIITCRTEYLAGRQYRSLFKADSRQAKDDLAELFIVPFEKEQVDAYLEKLTEQPQNFFKTVEDYREILDKIPGLNELVSTPFILSVITQVLPQLQKKHAEDKLAGSSSTINRVMVYETFVHYWFEREENKLRSNNVPIPEEYNFKLSFAAYCSDFAFQMFLTNKTSIQARGTNYEIRQLVEDEWGHFFKTKEEDIRVWLARQGAMVKKVGAQVGFLHKSILEYFVADLLVEELKKIAQSASEIHKGLYWNQKALNAEPSIILFVADRIQANYALKQALYALVEATKGHPELGQAGANAATTLNYAREFLGNQDWQGVQLPGADLTCALLAGTNFSGANLEGAVLRRALLREVNLSYANMKNTVFGQLPTIKLKEAVGAIAYHPQKPWLAIAQGNEIILIDQMSGQSIGQPMEHDEEVTSVAFSPDGKLLASGSGDKSCRLWQVSTQTAFGQLMGHDSVVTSVAFSLNGKLLASGSKDKSCRLWEVATEQPFGQPMEHESTVNSVAFSPDDKLLASGSYDRSCRLWQVASQTAFGQPMRGHQGLVNSVAFSPDGKLLASGSVDKSCRLWQVASQTAFGLPMLGHDGIVWSVAFSPNGKLLASGSDDKSCRLWEVVSQTPFGLPMLGHNLWVNSVVFSSDGKLLASGSWDKSCRLWQVVSQTAFGQPMLGHDDEVTSVAFSPDSKLLASGSLDNSCQLWQVASQTAFGQLMLGYHTAALSVAFSPDGKLLASGNSDSSCRLWRVASQAVFGQLMLGYHASVAFSPDSKLLASGSRGTSCRLWQVASQTAVGQPMEEHNDGELGSDKYSVAFSPDGKLLASRGYDNSCRLWQVASQTAFGQPMLGHDQSVVSVAFSPDGKLLASGSVDKSCRLWQVASQTAFGQLMGHDSMVTSVAFSPDGKLLASGSDDKSCRLWKVSDQRCLYTIAWNSNISAVAMSFRSTEFSNQSTMLAFGSNDGCISFWHINVIDDSDELDVRLIGLPSHVNMKLMAGGLQLQGAQMDLQTKRLLEEYGATPVANSHCRIIDITESGVDALASAKQPMLALPAPSEAGAQLKQNAAPENSSQLMDAFLRSHQQVLATMASMHDEVKAVKRHLSERLVKPSENEFGFSEANDSETDPIGGISGKFMSHTS